MTRISYLLKLATLIENHINDVLKTVFTKGPGRRRRCNHSRRYHSNILGYERIMQCCQLGFCLEKVAILQKKKVGNTEIQEKPSPSPQEIALYMIIAH